jgi:hypothetical protein
MLGTQQIALLERGLLVAFPASWAARTATQKINQARRVRDLVDRGLLAVSPAAGVRGGRLYYTTAEGQEALGRALKG